MNTSIDTEARMRARLRDLRHQARATAAELADAYIAGAKDQARAIGEHRRAIHGEIEDLLVALGEIEVRNQR